MNRPRSIFMFERLYLGSFAVWLIGLVVFWAQIQHQIAVVASHQPAAIANLAGYIANGSLILVAIVMLVLWYLVARRASNVAAWVVIITEAFGALSLVYTLYRLATGPQGLSANGYVNLLASILAIAAAVFLTRPDARLWLAGTSASPSVDVL